MQTLTVSQLNAQFQQILAQYKSGQISREHAEGLINQLRAQDENGVWWCVNASTGQFFYYNGQQWLPGNPLSAPPPPAQPAAHFPSAPAASFQPQSRPVRMANTPVSGNNLVNKWLRFAATPILALLPGAVCGGSWFLYTAAGLFKNEGIGGVDWLTPAILVGLPPFMWLISKPLDKLLLPFQSIRRAIPQPMRLGGALALPLVMSCLLTSLSTYGYGALRIASIVSIVVSYVLFRNPEVQS